jgi:hypothetical protein
MPTIISNEVSNYLESLVPARQPGLQAMEAYAREQDCPIIGPANCCERHAGMLAV